MPACTTTAKPLPTARPYRPPAVTAPQPRPARRPAGFGGAFFQHEPHLGGLPAAHHPAPCPDILLEHPTHGTIILDAKWKRPNGRHAENDLRQLFAYAHHFEATQVRLLYPQAGQEAAVEGEFTRPLFGAGGAAPQAIWCGVSYIGLGRELLTGSDVNSTGHLPYSVERELPNWFLSG